MAGKEAGGAGLAEAGLFRGAAWLFTPMDEQRTEVEREWVRLVEGFGARVMEMGAERHDEVCAWVSHLPQMLSTALSALLEETFAGDPEGMAAVQAIGGRALQGDDAAGGEPLQHVARCGDDQHGADCRGDRGAGAAAAACAGEPADAGAARGVPDSESISREAVRVPPPASFLRKVFRKLDLGVDLRCKVLIPGNLLVKYLES